MWNHWHTYLVDFRLTNINFSFSKYFIDNVINQLSFYTFDYVTLELYSIPLFFYFGSLFFFTVIVSWFFFSYLANSQPIPRFSEIFHDFLYDGNSPAALRDAQLGPGGRPTQQEPFAGRSWEKSRNCTRDWDPCWKHIAMNIWRSSMCMCICASSANDTVLFTIMFSYPCVRPHGSITYIKILVTCISVISRHAPRRSFASILAFRRPRPTPFGAQAGLNAERILDEYA